MVMTMTLWLNCHTDIRDNDDDLGVAGVVVVTVEDDYQDHQHHCHENRDDYFQKANLQQHWDPSTPLHRDLILSLLLMMMIVIIHTIIMFSSSSENLSSTTPRSRYPIAQRLTRPSLLWGKSAMPMRFLWWWWWWWWWWCWWWWGKGCGWLWWG